MKAHHCQECGTKDPKLFYKERKNYCIKHLNVKYGRRALDAEHIEFCTPLAKKMISEAWV